MAAIVKSRFNPNFWEFSPSSVSDIHSITQGDMLCVGGLRKWMLRTPTVTRMERVTRIMVKSRYLPEIK